MSHKSRVLVVGCSDPRLRRWLHWYSESLIKEKGFQPDQIDQLITPGAVPGLAGSLFQAAREALSDFIKILTAHDFDQIHLITHEDCAAIGGSGEYHDREQEKKAHEHLLVLAIKRVVEYFPEKEFKFKSLYVTRKEFEALNRK